MGATGKLLALHRVDQQLRGLRSRLDAAERYLASQEKTLVDLGERREAVQKQLRQAEAQAHNKETEVKGLEERIESLRDRMSQATTSKEHSALLTEINTLKADKSALEDEALESITQTESLRSTLEELEAQREEREKVREVALNQRDERATEIKERLDELETQRAEAEAEVPADALAKYKDRIDTGEEDIMAPCEEQSRRNMEYSCGACFTHLPMEQVNILLNRTGVTCCPACGVILYLEDELRDSFEKAAARRAKRNAKV